MDRLITWILIALVILLILFSFLPDFKLSDISKISEDVNSQINSGKASVKNSYFSDNRHIDSEAYFCPEDDCEGKLVELIDSSKKSIYCAVYDIGLGEVSDSLISAKDKNINVNIVTDYGESAKKLSKVGVLKSAGIPVITNPDNKSYMHNKFCVFDGKIVLVGSMNFTLNDVYKNNNNYLVIEDEDLADAFTEKINYFFSGEFSPEQNQDIEKQNIGNIEYYFCPEDNCEEQVLRKIKDLNSSIDCMFYSFTLDDVTDLLLDKNISKRFIFEESTIDDYSEYNRLVDAGIPAIKDKNPDNMHNKLCILDGNIVMTGSMNLSKNGTANNDESLLFVHDHDLARDYTNYFEKYWYLWK